MRDPLIIRKPFARSDNVRIGNCAADSAESSVLCYRASPFALCIQVRVAKPKTVQYAYTNLSKAECEKLAAYLLEHSKDLEVEGVPPTAPAATASTVPAIPSDAVEAKIATMPVCTTCGGVNVRSDAYAEWDEVGQKWSLVTAFDNTRCEDCGGECDVDWVPVHNPDDPICTCQNCSWRGLRSHLNESIPDYAERVAPGEPVPDGECPICKALAHVEEEEGSAS